MSKISVLAILPYESLKKAVDLSPENNENIEVDSYVGNLKNGVLIAQRQCRKKKYDLILSRGGTAELLKQNFPSKMILEIPISFEDVFHAIMLAKNYDERFAIVSFPVLTNRARSLCQLLRYSIEVYEIHSGKDAEELLVNLQNDGYTMVIGDVITAEMAKKLGLNVVLMVSGQNSVDEALKSISNFAIFKQNFERKSYYDSLIYQFSPFTILITDIHGNIQYSKKSNDEEHSIEFIHYFSNHHQKIINMKEKKQFFQINNDLFRIIIQEEKVNGQGYFLIFSEFLYPLGVQQLSGVQLQSNNKKNEAGYSIRNHFGVANSLGETKETIINYSYSSLPILIIGEIGTGKDAIANSLYLRRGEKDNPYFDIDCALINDKQWDRFLNKSSSPLFFSGYTIHMKNIQEISKYHVNLLIQIIKTTSLFQRNKIIFSATLRNDNQIPYFVRYLQDQTDCLIIHPQPLRARKKDLKNMCVVYLNQANVEFGKQIIGFDPEAEIELLNFEWPGNISQLKRVLRELVLETDTPYISSQSVKRKIKDEIFNGSNNFSYNIDLSQTLDQINYEVIRLKMKQDHLSQKEVANELGISRTTVWRILKSQRRC